MRLLYNHRNDEIGTLETTDDSKKIAVKFNDDNYHVDTVIPASNLEEWKKARGFKEVGNMTGEEQQMNLFDVL